MRQDAAGLLRFGLGKLSAPLWGSGLCGLLELVVPPGPSWPRSQEARGLWASVLRRALTPLLCLPRCPLKSAAVQWAAF